MIYMGRDWKKGRQRLFHGGGEGGYLRDLMSDARREFSNLQ